MIYRLLHADDDYPLPDLLARIHSERETLFIRARPELDWSSVYRHHTYMISSFVLALISAFKARRELVPADE